MSLYNILRCGHTFSSDEYELEIKYIMTSSFLIVTIFFLIIVTTVFFMIGDEVSTYLHAIGIMLSMSYLILARWVKKENYLLLSHLMISMFTALILYSYYLLGNIYPISAWIVILILASFLVQTFLSAIIVIAVYFLFLLYLNMPFNNDTFSYIILYSVPVFIGLLLVFILEKKFVSTILLLKNSNINLEHKVAERTAQLKKEKESLAYQAHHDDLTGLASRHRFYNELQAWIDDADKEDKNFFLLFIDLDRFKRVNDSLGHAIGDMVLKIVAKRIQNHMDRHAFLSRLSGDEFTLLLNDAYQLFDVENIAQSLIETIEEPMTVEDNVLYISASIGISQYPEDAMGYADLIKFADTSMFEAKKVGRGTYQFYNKEMTRKVKEIVLMETELHAAMKKHEFRLHYQPQIDSRDESLCGVELLIRWEHPTLGLLTPDKFIPLAEETGIIIALDYYILKCGMQQVSQWKKEGFELPRISFNFSTKYLLQENFIKDIRQLLFETGCQGEWIELEITESHIMANIDASIIVLDALHDLGIKIAIDDFGTGYSSLTYLKRLPADKLKIDKSFIEKISENTVDMTITKAIIEIGNSMGLTVLAEGVETQVQLDYLTEHHCYQIQGYIYHKALSKTEIEKSVFTRI